MAAMANNMAMGVTVRILVKHRAARPLPFSVLHNLHGDDPTPPAVPGMLYHHFGDLNVSGVRLLGVEGRPKWAFDMMMMMMALSMWCVSSRAPRPISPPGRTVSHYSNSSGEASSHPARQAGQRAQAVQCCHFTSHTSPATGQDNPAIRLNNHGARPNLNTCYWLLVTQLFLRRILQPVLDWPGPDIYRGTLHSDRCHKGPAYNNSTVVSLISSWKERKS
jgi:hypothetical protein